MNLKEPPKLVEIRTKGEVNTGLTGIQLIFENGLSSPDFDSENAGAEEYKSNQLAPNKHVTSIKMLIHDHTWPFHLSFLYEDGTEQSLSANFRNAQPVAVERKIPPNHVIVGVYGKMRDPTNVKRICSLGFILMDTTAFI